MEVELVIHGALAEIRLNRPSRKNALRGEDWLALRTAAENVARQGARALMIRGIGGDFCTGFDLNALNPGQSDALEIIWTKVNPALAAIRALPIPTVAAVEGHCVGGGLGIAAACDIVIASENARFGAPYSRIGIMADAGLHVFLREALGYQRAAYLIFTGKLWDAREAFAAGLCCEVLASAEFDAGARAFTQGLADGPTIAFSFSKRILREETDVDEALRAEARYQAEVFATEDAAIGMVAFASRGKATFRGR